jgi:hypothetical protein
MGWNIAPYICKIIFSPLAKLSIEGIPGAAAYTYLDDTAISAPTREKC